MAASRLGGDSNFKQRLQGSTNQKGDHLDLRLGLGRGRARGQGERGRRGVVEERAKGARRKERIWGGEREGRVR